MSVSVSNVCIYIYIYILYICIYTELCNLCAACKSFMEEITKHNNNNNGMHVLLFKFEPHCRSMPGVCTFAPANSYHIVNVLYTAKSRRTSFINEQ